MFTKMQANVKNIEQKVGIIIRCMHMVVLGDKWYLAVHIGGNIIILNALLLDIHMGDNASCIKVDTAITYCDIYFGRA